MNNPKLKKTLSLILSLIMILSTLSVLTVTSFAGSEEIHISKDGLWKYKIFDDNTISLKSGKFEQGEMEAQAYLGKEKNIIIPQKIDGYTVTEIGEGAFAKMFDELETISIPNTVKAIGVSAFEDCQKLKSINIPNSVEKIENFAFYSCTSLENVVLGENIKTIGDYAFHTTALNSIIIPKSVNNIGKYAFGYWDYETEPIVDKVTMYGYIGSSAEKYYKDYGKSIIFIALESEDTNPIDFPDIKEKDWFYDVVQYNAQKGFITGYQNGNFGPNDSLKRQDFVCILARIDGADLKAYENVQSKLTDVKKGDYYAAAVNWAVDKGYISGYQNGKFGVNDSITREQVATILYNYMNKPEVKDAEKILAKFPDANKVSSFAKIPVAWAVSNGVISGMGDGTVASTSGATRAQIAAIIQRMDTQGMFDK